jgi:hypothetical protein
VEVHGQGGLGEFQIVSDGSRMYAFFPAENTYVASRPTKNGSNIRAHIAEQIEFFFQPKLITAKNPGAKVAYGGTVTEDSVTYEVVEQAITGSDPHIIKYFISTTDKLIHGVSTIYPGDSAAASWAKLTNVEVKGAHENEAFSWRPPAGARPASLPAGFSLPIGNSPVATQPSTQ